MLRYRQSLALEESPPLAKSPPANHVLPWLPRPAAPDLRQSAHENKRVIVPCALTDSLGAFRPFDKNKLVHFVQTDPGAWQSLLTLLCLWLERVPEMETGTKRHGGE